MGEPSLETIPSHQLEVLGDLYRALGGIEDQPVFRPGAWDLSFADGLVIELDEELHFNRYRALTLDSPWSSGLPWTDVYRALCRDREADCLQAGRWGRRWTSSSTARMFKGGDPGDLTLGAPRWKQRALYDSIKDLVTATNPAVRLARISVFDSVNGMPLEQVLSMPPGESSRALLSLVESRTVRLP
ncbi:MAG TPA: hypothetical protein VHA80_13215 [Solirubrobacterales bacterium]|nr:hypothetical protein [Solirubrobacterales bacterium]